MIGFTNVIRMMFAKDDPSKHPPTDLHINTHKKIDASKWIASKSLEEQLKLWLGLYKVFQLILHFISSSIIHNSNDNLFKHFQLRIKFELQYMFQTMFICQTRPVLRFACHYVLDVSCLSIIKDLSSSAWFFIMVFFLLYHLPSWGIIYSTTIAFNSKVYKILYMSISLHPRNILCNIQQVTRSRTIATCTSKKFMKFMKCLFKNSKNIFNYRPSPLVFFYCTISQECYAPLLYMVSWSNQSKGTPYPQTNKRDTILITSFWIEQFMVLCLCKETKSLKNPWIIDILKFSHKRINELLPIINMLQHLVLW